MAKRGYTYKDTKQGGGYKGYKYVRGKAPGNVKALKPYSDAVKNGCSGAKGSKKAAQECVKRVTGSRKA